MLRSRTSNFYYICNLIIQIVRNLILNYYIDPETNRYLISNNNEVMVILTFLKQRFNVELYIIYMLRVSRYKCIKIKFTLPISAV